MKLVKVLMFGDRNWSDWNAINEVLDNLSTEFGTKRLLVISGGASGADTMAAAAARARDIHVAEVKALWETRRRAAGPQRNEVMRLLEPEYAFCFHEDLANSKGSKDMLTRLKKAGVYVEVHDGKGGG